MLNWDPLLSDRRERSKRIQQAEDEKNEVIKQLASLETPDEIKLLSELKEEQPNLYAMIFRKKMLNGPSWCLKCNVPYRFYEEILLIDDRVSEQRSKFEAEVPDGLKNLFARVDVYASRYACGRCKDMNSISKPKFTQDQIEEMFFSAGLKDDMFSTIKQTKQTPQTQRGNLPVQSNTQEQSTKEDEREQKDIFAFCEIMIKRMETLGNLFIESANDYREELNRYRHKKQNYPNDEQQNKAQYHAKKDESNNKRDNEHGEHSGEHISDRNEHNEHDDDQEAVYDEIATNITAATLLD